MNRLMSFISHYPLQWSSSENKKFSMYHWICKKNNLTVDAVVDSGAYLSPIAQNDLETIKQKAPRKVFNIDNPPNFHSQVAKGHLEKLLATDNKFKIRENIFVDYFVLMKNVTGPILGLNFMRNKSVVKTASKEPTTKPSQSSKTMP